MDDNRDLVLLVGKLGYNYAELSDSVKTHLTMICKYREKTLKSIELSETNMRRNYFSVSRIAHELECSRTTIYNNPVIKSYIDTINEELEKLNPYSKIENLEEEISELNKKIDLMMTRDTEIELLRLENNELKENLNKYEPKNIYNIK